MKKLFMLAVLAALCGLSLPLLNLKIDQTPPAQMPVPAQDSPAFQKARDVFQAKCLHCHFKGAALPYYANWPVAKKLIHHDIHEGLEYLNMKKDLYPKDGKPVSEVALAEIDYVLQQNSMPPIQYLAMHWRSFMTGAAKAAVMGWIHEVRVQHYAVPGAADEFKYHALQPIPDSVPFDPRKAELGRKLYHDVRLSKDNTLSCASCHDLKKGGTDRAPVSTGVNGQKGPINSPTVFNAGLQFIQFWDGRAKDLEEQARGPVHNPLEMGSSWEEVIPKLSQDAALTAEFQAVYPDGWKGQNIQNAIAEFEKTLITPNSRFDQYLKGNANALSAVEKDGFRIFMAKGCFTCHVGKAMGGQSFEKFGREKAYFKHRAKPVTDADKGRFNVTKKKSDLHKFKVPMLRNIAKTAPYFHDAATSDLKEAVKIMAKYQTEDEMSDEDAGKVAAFLETLTGEYQGKPVE